MFTQYELPYGFASLEPHIDELTMVTHYTKHHAGYTSNLNATLEKHPDLAKPTIEELLGSLDSIADEAVRTTIRNNGGGYWNHNLYFSTISPEVPRNRPEALLRRSRPTSVLSTSSRSGWGHWRSHVSDPDGHGFRWIDRER